MAASKRGARAVSASTTEISFVFRGVRCRERLNIAPSAAGLKRAERVRGQILDAIESETFDYSVWFPSSNRRHLFVEQSESGTLFEEFIESWFDKEKKKIEASTAKDYAGIVRILSKEFGQLELTAINRPAIDNWVENYPASNKRITNMLSVLRLALNRAVGAELIQNNPLIGWTPSKKDVGAVKTKGTIIEPFNKEEMSAILGALDGQAKNFVQFLFWTGLRTSEAIALRWTDIDFSRGVINVSRAFTQADRQHKGTKTYAGTRAVKIHKPALDALDAQRQYTEKSGDIIFLNPKTGEPWTGDQAIRKTMWIPALKRAGVRYRYPYQTRHTFASMQLSAEQPVLWVAAQMGHADWTMISRRYGKWIKQAIDNSGDSTVEIFFTEPTCSQKEQRQH